MKTHILKLTLVYGLLTWLPTTVLAQIEKGKWFVEGSIGDIRLNTQEFRASPDGYFGYSKYKHLGLAFSPSSGYFVTSKLALGASLDYMFGFQKGKEYDINDIEIHYSKSKSMVVNLSPLVRYYFLGTTRHRFYGQLGIGAGIGLHKYEFKYANIDGTEGDPYSDKSDIVTLKGSAAIGYNYFFSDKVAFNSSVGYSYNRNQQEVEMNNIYIDHLGSLSWNFGFTVILP